MKPFILISFLIISISSYAQVEKQINSILLKRDFKGFLTIAKNYSLEKDGTLIHKANIREIAGGFQEAMFDITKAYQINKGVSITCNPKLKILTHNNRIIYFYLESKEMKDFPKKL